MIRRGLAALAFPFAGIAMAEGITLQSPVDCVLGNTCYIQQYMDRDPGKGQRDYQCRTLSYDGHKGTDFALPTLADMTAGVNVLSAADGTVRGFRDEMPDTGYTAETAASIDGKECGNGLVLLHPGGWETQYCHMKQGSIVIQNGQQVKAGDVLGQIGMSGRAEFPHLHLSVRHNGEHIDPFDPDGTVTCATPGDSTLWADPPAYQPGGVVAMGLSAQVPEYADVKAGRAASDALTTQAPALVVFGFTFGTQKDDVVRLLLTGPDGTVFEQDQTLPRNHAQAFRAFGKKRPRRGEWPTGTYTATTTLLRDGNAISTMTQSIEVTAP
jgi:hypothetical protein